MGEVLALNGDNLTVVEFQNKDIKNKDIVSKSATIIAAEEDKEKMVRFSLRLSENDHLNLLNLALELDRKPTDILNTMAKTPAFYFVGADTLKYIIEILEEKRDSIEAKYEVMTDIEIRNIIYKEVFKLDKVIHSMTKIKELIQK